MVMKYDILVDTPNTNLWPIEIKHQKYTQGEISDVFVWMEDKHSLEEDASWEIPCSILTLL